MMATQIFVGFCASLVLTCCLSLIFFRDYEDGVIGRVGLSLIGLGALGRILSTFDTPVSNIGVLVWAGMALFLCRHLYRFLRWRKHGAYAWRPTRSEQAPGKQANH